MAHVQRIARARVVHVEPAVVRDQAVVGRVVDPLERKHRAEVIAFRRVVVHHVQDHFDTRLVHRLHETLEFLHLFAVLSAGGIFIVRREIADGVVAPVVAQPAFNERRILHELLDRQQFDRRDAEFLQVGHRHRVGHAGVGAADLLRDVRVSLREPLDVRLVHDRAVPGCVRPAVGAPVEERVDHDALRHPRRAVEIVARVFRIGEVVGEDGLVPLPRAVHRLRVRIEQQFRRIAPVSLLGGPRAVHPEPVSLPRAHVGHVAVPAEGGAFRQIHARFTTVLVEQTQLDAVADLRKQRKIGSDPVERCPERIGASRPDLHEVSD